MIQRFYLDTSVIGGVFDIEFEKHSSLLMENIKQGNIKAIISNVTEKEIMKARMEVRHYFTSLPSECIDKIELSDEAIQLAEKYIQEKIVGRNHLEDCLHIAMATIHRADILVSWNFKHIVNIYRIRAFNAVNLKSGYPLLEIRSPKEIV